MAWGKSRLVGTPSQEHKLFMISEPALGSVRFLSFIKLSLTITTMVTITFPDRETEKRALAFLLGRFSGRVLRSGEHIVPEAALEALADQNIPFSVIGRTTYEQQMAAIRGPAPTSVQ